MIAGIYQDCFYVFPESFVESVALEELVENTEFVTKESHLSMCIVSTFPIRKSNEFLTTEMLQAHEYLKTGRLPNEDD